jgi:hypothetical protein
MLAKSHNRVEHTYARADQSIRVESSEPDFQYYKCHQEA